MIEYAAIIILIVIVLLLLKINAALRSKLREFEHKLKSLSVKHGKMAEQFIPFLKTYKYNPENFRFIGTPIDGVQFNPEKIVFVEFKTSSSKLSGKQKDIKNLVEKKKVEFEEMRM